MEGIFLFCCFLPAVLVMAQGDKEEPLTSSAAGSTTPSLLSCPTIIMKDGGGGSVLPFYDLQTVLDLGCATSSKCVGILCMCLDDELPSTTNCSLIRTPVKCPTAVQCLAAYMTCIENAAAIEAKRDVPTSSSSSGQNEPPAATAAQEEQKQQQEDPAASNDFVGDLCILWGRNLTAYVAMRNEWTTRVSADNDDVTNLYRSCESTACQVLEAVTFRGADASTPPEKLLAACSAQQPDLASSTSSGGWAAAVLGEIAGSVCPARQIYFRGPGKATVPPPPPPPTPPIDVPLVEENGFCSAGPQDRATSYLDTYFPAVSALEQCPLFSKCASPCFYLYMKSDPSLGPDEELCTTYTDECLRTAATCVTSLSWAGSGTAYGGAATAANGAGGGEGVATGSSKDACSLWGSNMTTLINNAQTYPEKYAQLAFDVCVGLSCSILDYMSMSKCKPNTTAWTKACSYLVRRPPVLPDIPQNGGGTAAGGGTTGGSGPTNGASGGGNKTPPPTEDPNAGLHPSGGGGTTNNNPPPPATANRNTDSDLGAPCPTYGGVTYYNSQQLFSLGCASVNKCLSDLCSCVGAALGATSCDFSSSNRTMDCAMAPACLQKGYACIRKEAALANASSGPTCSTWGKKLSGAMVAASMSSSMQFDSSSLFSSCRYDACNMLQDFITASKANASACVIPNASWHSVCSNNSGVRVQHSGIPLPISANAPVTRIAYKMSFPGSFDAVLASSPADLAALKKAFEQGLTSFIGVTVVVDSLQKGSLIVSFHSLAASTDMATASVIVQNAAALTTTADLSWMAGASSLVQSLGGPLLQSPLVSSAVVSTIANSPTSPAASSASTAAVCGRSIASITAALILIATLFA